MLIYLLGYVILAAFAQAIWPEIKGADTLTLTGVVATVLTFILVIGQTILAAQSLRIVERQAAILQSQDEQLAHERRRREEQMPILDMWFDSVRPGNPESILARQHKDLDGRFHDRSIIVSARNTGVDPADRYLVEVFIPSQVQIRPFIVNDQVNIPTNRYDVVDDTYLRCYSFMCTSELKRSNSMTALLGLQIIIDPSEAKKECTATFEWRLTYQGRRFPAEHERGKIEIHIVCD